MLSLSSREGLKGDLSTRILHQGLWMTQALAGAEADLGCFRLWTCWQGQLLLQDCELRILGIQDLQIPQVDNEVLCKNQTKPNQTHKNSVLTSLTTFADSLTENHNFHLSPASECWSRVLAWLTGQDGEPGARSWG